MESEKVKEIKKALEQNDDNGIMYEVNDKKHIYKFIHHKDILTLINKLESENERLKTQLAQANAGIVNCSGCKLVELNAVKEFAEMLKECAKSCKESGYDGIGVDDIEIILKEYEK